MNNVEDYLRLSYQVVVRDEGEYGWSAEILELPGCVAGSDSREDLAAMIDDAKWAWLENALKHGDPIPLPDSVAAGDRPRPVRFSFNGGGAQRAKL
jgi:antitoxin HicB